MLQVSTKHQGENIMNNEIDKKQVEALQAMVNSECLQTVPELDFSMNETTKIPLTNLSALGVAFQPLTAAIQTAISRSGGSGVYYVNTKGMQMFSTSDGFIGSLKSASGTVGGGQARMTPLACDPTMLFMAAALMNIEKKLDNIQETQVEILEFLEEKECAVMQGNLNVLGDVMSNFKYNWDNDTYKSNKHILVQQIKKEAESSIILYRDQIAKKIKKRSLIHSDQEVKVLLKKLQVQFKDYQLALYLYSYSTFLEIMLLGNFDEGYLNNIEQRISDYSSQYHALYSECYNLMENYSKSSIQSGMLSGLSVASKFMGDKISKIPVINKSQLDKSLIEVSNKLDIQGEKRTSITLEELMQSNVNVIQPFIDNIRTVNDLSNKPVTYLFDKENVYIHQANA